MGYRTGVAVNSQEIIFYYNFTLSPTSSLTPLNLQYLLYYMPIMSLKISDAGFTSMFLGL